MASLDRKERLALLDAETLELRRLKISLITVYRFLFGLMYIDFKEYCASKQGGSTRDSSDHNYIYIYLFATKAEKKKKQIHHKNAYNRPYSERNTLKGSNKRLYKNK